MSTYVESFCFSAPTTETDNTLIIVLAVFGGLLLIGLIAGLLFYFCYYKPKKDKSKIDPNEIPTSVSWIYIRYPSKKS